MTQMVVLRRLAALLLVCSVLSSLAPSQVPTTPPPHPRILFTGSQISDLQTRALTAGTPAFTAYNRMVTSVSLSVPSDQLNWSFMRTMRRMQEVAYRYVITGNASYRTSARNALMNAVNGLTATGSNGPYQAATYPCAIANTYDMLYNSLSPTDRADVVTHLEDWISALRIGTNAVSSYSGYLSATDNYSIAWSTGIVMAGLAIWGDSNYPNLMGHIQSNLARLHGAWTDSISPDGSVDENYGYANYGTLYSMYAGIAAQNCGFGDVLGNTNALKVSSWFGRSLVAGAFPWTGDSSPVHKGLRIDPIIYYPITRNQSPEDLWGVNKLFNLLPIADAQVTMAFSPYIAQALHYPCAPMINAPGASTVIAQAPAVVSRFYRDNLNVSPPSINKVQSNSAIGDGGTALLHNSAVPGDKRLAAIHIIRDEWMNHSHEDDGHLGIFSDGQKHFIDLSYVNNAQAQHTNHNIVVVSGGPGFQASNRFSPPSPAGRFLGRRRASLFSKGLDYIRGSHENMWMMEKAIRTVAMIKDPASPYIILIDEVRKNGNQSYTYEELFHASSSAAGAGTAANPMRITKNGRVLRSVWLSPGTISVTPGGYTSAAGVVSYRNRVRATGSEMLFLSVHSAMAPAATTPLNQPNAGTQGGNIQWPGFADKILVRSSGSTLADNEIDSDGRFAWTRRINGNLKGWAMAEGSRLQIGNERVLTTSEPATVSARGESIDIVRSDQSTPVAAFEGCFIPPFPAQSVTIDGQNVSFLRLGRRIIVSPTANLGPFSLDDRIYTFSEGHSWDALLSSNASLVGERMGSNSGWATIRPRSNGSYEARPISVGIDVLLAAGTTASQGWIKLGSNTGGQDILFVKLRRAGSPGMGAINLLHNGAQIASYTLPLATPVLMRVNISYDPLTGLVELHDALGNAIGSATVGTTSVPFHLQAQVLSGSYIDNFSIFDSAEDGVTPQGMAMWAAPSGKVGFAVHHPSLATWSNASLLLWGSPQPGLLQSWLVGANFQEVALTAYLAPGQSPTMTFRELVWESASPASIQGSIPLIGLRTHVMGSPLQSIAWPIN